METCSLLWWAFKNYLIIFYERVFCPHECKYTLGMPDAHRGQKTVLDALEEQLQMFVNDHVSAGN